jgi:hypothetical protein
MFGAISLAAGIRPLLQMPNSFFAEFLFYRAALGAG